MSGIGSNNGWLEAAIAWEVCASLHLQYCKGKDVLFTTRQSDFVKHAENARKLASRGQAPAGAAQAAPVDAESWLDLLAEARAALWQPANAALCERLDAFIDAARAAHDVSFISEGDMAAREQEDVGGWRRAGALLYRLTGEHRPTNFDEIRVTMANGSRDIGQMSAQAERLLVMLTAPQPAAQAALAGMEPVATVTCEGVMGVSFTSSSSYGCDLVVGTKLYTAAQVQAMLAATRKPLAYD